jgi:hypothetical protein
MRARGASVVAILVAVLLAGVGGAADGAGAPVGPDPAVQEWPDWPYETSCGSLSFDPVQAFSGPTGVERGSRPSEVALRKFLNGEDWVSDYVPLRHWRLLAETSDEAEFASGRLASPYGPATLSFELKDGQWSFWGLSGGCAPTSIVNGRQAVTWKLAVGRPFPRENARHLWIDLGPGECSSGRSQNARARKPVFWRVGGKLLMAMTLRPLPPGGYTCEGVIEPPMRVKLPVPFSDVRLFDGGVYPPRNVRQLWRDARRGERATRR